MLVNVLLTRVSLHTRLQFRAYINGIGEVTGLFFFSSTKETFFFSRLPFDDQWWPLKDLKSLRGTPPMSWFWSSARMIFATVCDADTVALSIVAFTELLIKSLYVPFVVVCQILPRMHTPFDGYNERVQKVNSLLREAKFWRHCGLVNPAKNIYVRDGIHLNVFGNEALYRSYRGAILFALSQFH